MSGAPSRDLAGEIARAEAQRLGSLSERLEEVGARAAGLEPLLAWIGEKERLVRVESHLGGEIASFRRLGWKLFRPLVAVSVLGGAAFLLQRRIDPVLGATLYLGGVASMYAGAQVLFELRARAATRRLEEARTAYRDRVRDRIDARSARS